MLKVPAINCKFRGAMNDPRFYMLLYNLILYRNRVMPCVRQTTPIADNHIHRIVLLLLRCWPSLAQLAARGGNDEEKLQQYIGVTPDIYTRCPAWPLPGPVGALPRNPMVRCGSKFLIGSLTLSRMAGGMKNLWLETGSHRTVTVTDTDAGCVFLFSVDTCCGRSFYHSPDSGAHTFIKQPHCV